jgi:hypothetical protein
MPASSFARSRFMTYAWSMIRNIPIRVFVAAGGLLVLGILSMYLPWKYTFHAGSIHREESISYYWVFKPPQPPERYGVAVDWPRALPPMGFVVVATVAGLWLACGAPLAAAPAPAPSPSAASTESPSPAPPDSFAASRPRSSAR